jgi:hypothetical protein
MITVYVKIFGHASKHRVQYGTGTVQYQQHRMLFTGTGVVRYICIGGFIADPDP